MEEKYNVVYTGRLKPGADRDLFVERFSERFRTEPEKAKRLSDAGKEIVLKKDLDRKSADAYRKALEDMGMDIRLDATAPPRQELSLAPDYEPAEMRAASERCPKCGSARLDKAHDTCLDCGVSIAKYKRIMSGETAAPEAGSADPYAAPDSRLATEGPEQMTGPISLPIGHGGRWIAAGWSHFRRNPGAWILVVIIWIGMSLALEFIPLVGPLVLNFISPVLIGGLMLGCQAQDRGDPFEVGHLFAGFSQNTGQLLLLGVFYLIAGVLVIVALGSVAGGAFALMGGAETLQSDDPEMMFDAMGGSTTILLMFLVAMALSIPLAMATWFATPLIVIEGMSAFSAMKLSFIGCLKNILPFLWYGVLAVLLMIAGTIPIGLGLLVVMPMLIASVYAAFREIYYGA